MKLKIFLLFLFFCFFFALFFSCKKDPVTPPNPYDAVDYPGDKNTEDTLNPASFVSIHKNIIVTKCAMPGCHDGHFEPDYRSVQSSYNTLVYHPVTKKLAPWIFRVVPYDTGGSWLWQRINHELIISGSDTSQGRMPLYSAKLTSQELANISQWIMDGAKDLSGKIPPYPDYEPEVTGYIATDPTFTIRYDTTRMDGITYNPFVVDTNTQIEILVSVTDDITPVANLIHNQMKFSAKADDFSGAVSVSGFYLSAGTCI